MAHPLDPESVAAQGLARLRAAAHTTARYRRYYQGEHDLHFATDKFRSTFGGLFHAFADNVMPLVVDSLADRLIIDGFDGLEAGGDASDMARARVGTLARSIWERERMPRRARATHVEALITGSATLIVWPDTDGRPRLYPQRADECAVGLDVEQPGRVAWAMKLWQRDDGRLRATVYLPDAIYKYVTVTPPLASVFPASLDAFEPFRAPDEPWPLPNPYARVPVFLFSNNVSAGTHSGEAGRSELHDACPLQDALNKTMLDTLVAQEYVALPQRILTGIEWPVDEATGAPVPARQLMTDRIWAIANPDARVIELARADIAQLHASARALRAEIALVTRTPAHFFALDAGRWPSGEALKTAETPFLSRVRDRQVAFGDAWEDVLAFALLLAGEPDARLETRWQPAEQRSDNDIAQRAQAYAAVGLGAEQALRAAGWMDADAIELAQADIIPPAGAPPPSMPADNPDLAFVDGMIVHHQSIIAIAAVAETHATRPETRDLSRAIPAAQQPEIQQLLDWRAAWYPDAPESADMAVMDTRAMGGPAALAALAASDPFDLAFLTAVIAHHRAALDMARAILSTATRPELIAMANGIITAQTREIAQARQWIAAWYPAATVSVRGMSPMAGSRAGG